ncbi:hypothetical protein GBA52_026057 [Prunus armeniaca]|nr:hypothetical protein GBA52_026057 [Prunus armeniaca]
MELDNPEIVDSISEYGLIVHKSRKLVEVEPFHLVLGFMEHIEKVQTAGTGLSPTLTLGVPRFPDIWHILRR